MIETVALTVSDKEVRRSDADKIWWVYIIRTCGGRLYTGITTDPERRFREHREDPRRGAKFFRTDPAEQIVYAESLPGRAAASRREAFIKQLNRRQKLALIECGS